MHLVIESVVLGQNDEKDKLFITPDSGKLIENITAIELLRKGKELYYYKTKDGKEVDFAIKEVLEINGKVEVAIIKINILDIVESDLICLCPV